MIELKDHQLEEMEGKLQFHSSSPWWHRFWFLAGFSSSYPLEKKPQWRLDRSSFFLIIEWHHSTGLHSELQPLCSILCSGPMPQKLTVLPQIKKIPLPFHESWISSLLQLLLLPFFFVLSLGLCQEPAWGAPPVAKVMRKEARHTQRRDGASGVPLEILYPQNQSLSTLLLCALTYTSDFMGGCPPPPLSEKVNL